MTEEKTPEELTAAALAKEKEAAGKAAELKKNGVDVLVLSDCSVGKCGTIVRLSKDDASAAKAGGLVDDNAAAVKAAKG